MRRRNPKPSRRRRVVRRLLAGLVAAAGLYVWVVETEVKPRVEELAEYECRAIVVEAMNQAVSDEMQRTPALYEKLYTLSYAPDGTLCTVQADTAALNRARQALVNAVQQALAQLPEKSWTIPLGSLSGWTVLGGWGPGWDLSLQPRGYVEGRMEQDAESLSINRTRYTVTLVLQVTINMVLDGKHNTAVVAERIPVADLLLDGAVPRYYGG